MPCCGEPKKGKKDFSNRPTPQQTGPVVIQPGLHPPPQFQPPNVTPPPIHASGFPQNGFGIHSQPPWTHSPPPPPANDLGAQHGLLTGSTNLPASTYNGSTFNVNGSPGQPSIARPLSAQRTQSPPLGGLPPGASPPTVPAPRDEGRMSVAIDFGTTFSGIAYGSSRIAGGAVQQILIWPGSSETFRKIPTCLLYDEYGRVLAWGLEAKNASPMVGTTKCEWFKLFLEPHALRDGAIDPRLPALPLGKKPVDLVLDFLSCLWEYAKEQITRDIGAVADLNSADVWLTVPAAWDARGCDIMREAAIAAGLVQSAYAGDNTWRDRLRIITEPEAAAVHCAQLADLHHLKPSQNFIVCDAGGGTVDLAVYKIIGQMAHLEIAEMCARSGSNCGSLFLDLRFRGLVTTLLADHPVHLDPPSLAYFMHAFSETDKLSYGGIPDDDNMFHFTCFNIDDPHDPSVGLINGQLSIPGNLLRREVFDPVVNEVLQLIEEQLARVHQPVHALLLVGGFAGSEYLKQRVYDQFASRIPVIARPPDADTATLRGAAAYGLARRTLVSSVIAPRSYIMKVKLPAEQEDWIKRPAYIKNNDAGVAICENRLQYLVSKGAILRKGQRLTTKFCKFSQTPQDSSFVATLFTCDTERLMRYTDEGELSELCKWTVDLSSLPTFRQNATVGGAGFYTEFELGLELDSAEVRGILLYNESLSTFLPSYFGYTYFIARDCVIIGEVLVKSRPQPTELGPGWEKIGNVKIMIRDLADNYIRDRASSSHSSYKPNNFDIPLENLYNLLEPIICAPKFANWARTFSCTPLAVFEPESEFQVELVLELARREGRAVRAVGVGHSPSDLACTSQYMLRMTKLNRVLEVNTEKRYVVAQAGITLDDLNAQLFKNNLAMTSLGSISEQTLGGVVTTATHGSGINYGVISTHVMALSLLLPDGSRISCSRHERPDLFMASLCGLGLTGIILSVQVEVEPVFKLKEIKRCLPFDEVISTLNKHVHSAEHVRLWWFPSKDVVTCSYSNRTKEDKDPATSWWWGTFWGHHVIQLLLFIARYIPALTIWIGNLAAWLARGESVGVDDSFKIFNVDCRYPQHTTEWAIPYQNAEPCLKELRTYLQRELNDPTGIRPHFPVEIRFSSPDDIWLSPSNGQRTCWIGIVQYKPYGFNIPYRKFFQAYEEIVTKYQGRPHWAKAHLLKPEDLRRLYPRFEEFIQVVKDVDPQGMLSNEYVQRHIFGQPIDPRVFKKDY